MVLKHYLLDFNWYRAVTQCMHIINVLTTKLRIKIVRKGIPSRTRRSVHSYNCGQTVGWPTSLLGKEVGLGPGHIVLDGYPVETQPPQQPLSTFRPMPIVAKRSPISATAELLFVLLTWNHVHVHYMLSPVRLSVVCNARAPYSGGWNFRQYFYGIWYLSLLLTSTENFTESVPGEPLRRGS